MKLYRFLFTSVLFVFIFGMAVESGAIPVFSRKYGTSCSTCHYAYPKLNAFGRAFLNNGYRYPEGTDPEQTKQDPTSMGAESYKRVFPDAIWPSDIPGSGPIGLRVIGRTNATPDQEPKLNFEFPHEFELLFGGTLGESFSIFGELEVEHESDLEYGFAIQYDYRPQFHVRVGNVEVMPIHEHTRLTAAHYNYGNYRASSGSVSNRWRFRDGQSGIELWGAGPGANGKGGYKYNIGLVNGQGSEDVNVDKDIYGRFSYKFGGLSEIGGTVDANESNTGFWLDNSLTLGAFFYKGNSMLSNDAKEWENSFNVVGLNWDLFYSDINVFGALLKQNDDDPNGTSVEKKFTAFFTEADYVFYPWMIGGFRYEWDKVENSDSKSSVVPAMTFMVRANAKIIFELQKRLDDAGKNNDKFVVGFDLGF